MKRQNFKNYPSVAAKDAGSTKKRPVLKPKNTSQFTTPVTARQSFLPRPTSGPSNGEREGLLKRPSFDAPKRQSSFSLGRFTPQHNNVAPSGLAMSLNRLSTDSGRSSNVGRSVRKEAMQVTDPVLKATYVEQILEYLVHNHFDREVSRKSLLNGTTKEDFLAIFTFLYKKIDPSFKMPPVAFPEEIVRVMKCMSFPGTLNKSLFTSVGVPHSWPSVLGMIFWLVQMINYTEDFDTSTHLLENEIDVMSKIRNLEIVIQVQYGQEMYKDNPDQATLDEIVQDHHNKIFAIYGVRQEDLQQLQENIMETDKEIHLLETGPERLQQLQLTHQKLTEDTNNMAQYCSQLTAVMEATMIETRQLQMQDKELKAQLSEIKIQQADLKQLQLNQNYSAVELAHFKNHQSEVNARIETLEERAKQLKEEIHSAEHGLCRRQKNCQDMIHSYNCAVRQLQLADDYQLTGFDAGVGDYTQLLDQLREAKRAAQRVSLQRQSILDRLMCDVDTVEEHVSDKKTTLAKIVGKLHRTTEEIELQKTDHETEEKFMYANNENQQQLIMELRRDITHKHGLQLQKGADVAGAQKELATFMSAAEVEKAAGIKFLKEVSETSDECYKEECEIVKKVNQKVEENMTAYEEEMQAACQKLKAVQMTILDDHKV